MITRRFPHLMAMTTVAVTALLATSCSSVSHDAARVGARTLSASELDDMVISYETSTQGPDANIEGPREATTVRDLLSTWVATSVVLEMIADADGAVSDADLADAEASLNQQSGFAEADEKVRELFILNTAANTILARLLAPSASELESSYLEGPATSGVVCVRAILANSQENIDLAASRVAAGESFADVAAELSIDPSGADGGVLGGAEGNECIDFDSVVESVAIEFVEVLANTPIGEVSPAFEIPNVGWAILLPRAFDEVSDDITALVGDRLVTTATAEAARSTDVWIAAEYGRWDPSTGTVVALG